MIDSLEKIVETKRNLDRLMMINKNISEHLIGSTIQLLRYGEKYNVIIPKRDQLEGILRNTQIIFDLQKEATDTFNFQNRCFNDSDQPTKNDTNNDRLGHRTHNYIRPHSALDGMTPSERCGIEIKGDNKWITLIQNASKMKN